MSNKETNKVPPDGGYGWVVTFAYALNNVVVLPLITSFGLILQKAMTDTELTTTQVTLIIILNHSIGMLVSLFGGPALKGYGYRKVAVAGALFISGGLMLTSISTEFWQFVLSYSILCSIGITAIMAAFSLAINSFFKDKRARATAAGMSITGLGTIYMPFLISALIDTYDWRDAIFILSAICLHSLLAACLLRPAKWYLIDPPTSDEVEPLNKETEIDLNRDVDTSLKAEVIRSLPQLEESVENGVQPIKSVSMRSLTSSSAAQMKNDGVPAVVSEARYKWWESQEINLGSSISIFNETDNAKNVNNKNQDTPDENKTTSPLANFVQFFDLTLLTDPIFVNIIVGLSIAACVETSFSSLLPIILHDMLKFETYEIARVMSVIGLSDTLFRFVSPFIGEWSKKSPRIMFMISLLLTIFTRTVLLFTTSFTGMLVIAVALGITKALRTVYIYIVIPSYVPIHRLAFASGLQTFFSGITILTIGSILTRVRVASGSYQVPIIVLNFVTMITIITWSAEFLYFRYKNTSKAELRTNK